MEEQALVGMRGPVQTAGREVRLMPTGRCHLCLETRELRDSHFIPAAFYKLLRAPGEKNPDPVVVNRNTQKQTSQQYRGQLLCAICEDLFNKGGEKWVLTNGWRTETDFPLRNALLAATPIPSNPPHEAFAAASIPAVDVDQLTYFAASIFWRGCLRGWRGVAGDTPVRLDLGSYEEGLRLFLLGRRAFPTDAVLVTALGVSMEVARTGVVIPPWTKERHPGTGYEQHRFVVPGICFDMFTGHGIPTHWRDQCIVRSPNRLVHRSPSVDYWIFEDSQRGCVDLAGSRLRRKTGQPKS